MTGGTRIAVRLILLDPSSHVLLFEGRDLSDEGDAMRFWFTAGGGVNDGESLLVAAHRELEEETGQSGLELMGPFFRREFDFLNHGQTQRQIEHFFAARTTSTAVSIDAWTELEQLAMTEWSWWSVSELQAGAMQFFPDNLIDLVLLADQLV